MLPVDKLVITAPIRVMIADDHVGVRDTMAIALDTQEDMHLVGKAANGYQAVLLSAQTYPHVILMDVEMPEMDGITAMGLIRQSQPQVQIIALTPFPDNGPGHAARTAGASAVLPKIVPYAIVLEEIRAAFARGANAYQSQD